jgi:N-acetylglucosamine-6-sulfatase
VKNSILFLAACTGLMSAGANQEDKKDVSNLDLPQKANVKMRNVIFILTDDHRYDYMGFTGKVPWLKTPNMDKLAAEGAYLKNAFVTTSLCSPSRASILTGQYSHVHTIVDNQAPRSGWIDLLSSIFTKGRVSNQFLRKVAYGKCVFRTTPRI